MLLNYNENELDDIILKELVEKNGFISEDIGTSFYKDVIKEIIILLDSYQDRVNAKTAKVLHRDLFKKLDSISLSADDLSALIDYASDDMQKVRSDIIAELQSPYSFLYFEAARSFLKKKFSEKDLVFFHTKIKESISKTSLENDYVAGTYRIACNIYDRLVYSREKEIDDSILNLLVDGNGFSKEDKGTYFYKDIIKGIIFLLQSYQNEANEKKEQIEKITNLESLASKMGLDNINISISDLTKLIDQEKEKRQNDLRMRLQDYNSMFYHYVSRNFSKTDLDTFYNKIEEAASKTGLKTNYLAAVYHLGFYAFKLFGYNDYHYVSTETSQSSLIKQRLNPNM